MKTKIIYLVLLVLSIIVLTSVFTVSVNATEAAGIFMSVSSTAVSANPSVAPFPSNASSFIEGNLWHYRTKR